MGQDASRLPTAATDLHLAADLIYSAIAFGSKDNPGLMQFEDDHSPPPLGRCRMRLVHVANASIPIGLTDQGNLTIDPVDRASASQYSDMDCGFRDLGLVSNDGSTLLDLEDSWLKTNSVYTLLVSGNLEDDSLRGTLLKDIESEGPERIDLTVFLPLTQTH